MAERLPEKASGRSSERAAGEQSSPFGCARYSVKRRQSCIAAKQGGTTGQSVLREGLARVLLLLSLRLHSNARAGIAYPPRFRSLKGRNSPSWGACSLSADLTTGETPATGGRPWFVPARFFLSLRSRAEKPQGRKISFSRLRSLQKFFVLPAYTPPVRISVKGSAP